MTIAWIPQEGDTIVGVITQIAWVAGKYRNYPVLTIKTTPFGPHQGKELRVHGCATSLCKKLMDRKPPVGSEIQIKFNGLRSGPNGTYNSYTVKSHTDQAVPELPFSWEGLG